MDDFDEYKEVLDVEREQYEKDEGKDQEPVKGSGIRVPLKEKLMDFIQYMHKYKQGLIERDGIEIIEDGSVDPYQDFYPEQGQNKIAGGKLASSIAVSAINEILEKCFEVENFTFGKTIKSRQRREIN